MKTDIAQQVTRKLAAQVERAVTHPKWHEAAGDKKRGYAHLQQLF